ncbi:MAG: hypothetical protein LBF93_11550 [Zoogloeaceae bacterium]|jgi:DNA-directed RNA polymerase specialized sigma24 family protein|nr:hypothetical protein [Zoogloeaceae bacterium]
MAHDKEGWEKWVTQARANMQDPTPAARERLMAELWRLGAGSLATRLPRHGANSDWQRYWEDAREVGGSIMLSCFDRDGGIAGLVREYDEGGSKISFADWIRNLLAWRFKDKLAQRRNADKKLVDKPAFPSDAADGGEEAEKHHELPESQRDLDDSRLWIMELCERAKLEDTEIPILFLDLHDYSRKEGAEILGIPENRYKSALERLRGKIKRVMDFVVIDLRIGVQTLTRPICATPLEIGRCPQGPGTLWVNDKSKGVSRRHLVLEKSDGGLFTVENRGHAQSGTYRNKQKPPLEEWEALPARFTLDPRKEEWIMLGNHAAQIRLRLDKGWREQAYVPNPPGPGAGQQGTLILPLQE